MSNRNTVMHCIAKNPTTTLDELVGDLGKDRQKIQWTINDCKADGLLEVRKDDVTGKPAYRLTTKGKAWLISRPANDDDAPDPEEVKQVADYQAKTDAARAEKSAIVQFCEWVRKTTKSKHVPMTLEECREILTAAEPPQPLGYLVAIPESHTMHDSADAAMKYAEQIVRDEGCACVCAVIAEAKAEIVWQRSA